MIRNILNRNTNGSIVFYLITGNVHDGKRRLDEPNIRLLYLHKVKRLKRNILYQRLVWQGAIKKKWQEMHEYTPAISIHPFVA
jgi:DNA repair exonuclease SbcCD nuclease subunit